MLPTPLPCVPVCLKSLRQKPWGFEPQTLGEHILKRRLELGLEQKDVADEVGVTNDSILNWERGYSKVATRHMPAVIRFLGYDPEPSTGVSLADRLKAKRRELGWSQERAARHVGVDPGTWLKWERGIKIVSRHHQRLEAFLNEGVVP